MESRDLLMTAYQVLGQSLNVHRNATATVRLAVPALARTALLVLAFDRQQTRWWAAGPGTGRSGNAVTAAMPDWIRAVLTGSDGIRVHPLGHRRRDLPGGSQHDGHGAVVQLSCADQCQGLLVLLRDAGQPPFSDADRRLAAEFAAPVSRAVTAAVLYRDQADLAERLRAALVPDPLPVVAGIELAAAYRPARETYRLGGDILHVESLANGGAVCALGDICGKGVEAAVAGDRLRRSLQALLPDTRQPLDLLSRLNDAIFDPDTADPTRFATLLVGVLRVVPDGGALLRLAAGGHPPPLVVRRTGVIEAEHIGGMMLGAEPAATFAETVIWLAPGEACVLYTDGVTDAEGGPLGAAFGRRRLADLLAGYAGMPAALVAERIEQCTSDWLHGADHDDIAVLVVRAL